MPPYADAVYNALAKEGGDQERSKLNITLTGSDNDCATQSGGLNLNVPGLCIFIPLKPGDTESHSSSSLIQTSATSTRQSRSAQPSSQTTSITSVPLSFAITSTSTTSVQSIPISTRPSTATRTFTSSLILSPSPPSSSSSSDSTHTSHLLSSTLRLPNIIPPSTSGDSALPVTTSINEQVPPFDTESTANHTAIVAGTVVGSFLGVALIVVAVEVCISRRRRQRRRTKPRSPGDEKGLNQMFQRNRVITSITSSAGSFNSVGNVEDVPGITGVGDRRDRPKPVLIPEWPLVGSSDSLHKAVANYGI